jgi:hypothetical protein
MSYCKRQAGSSQPRTFQSGKRIRDLAVRYVHGIDRELQRQTSEIRGGRDEQGIQGLKLKLWGEEM